MLYSQVSDVNSTNLKDICIFLRHLLLPLPVVLPAMDSITSFFVFLAAFSTCLSVLPAEPPEPVSHITVLGSVYCDVCYDNTFSKHSYFLPGADVHIQCKFKASFPRTNEQIAFSVNRTTNKYGMYKLDIPSVDGVECSDYPAIQSFCQASLIGSSYSACNLPGLKSSSTEMTVKSKENNVCTYTLGALSYRPQTKNISLCGNQRMESPNSVTTSKFFLPFIPPYGIPWLPLPQLPPLPSLPPLPPLPPFPFPFPPVVFPKPPSLPSPFQPVPPNSPPPPPPTFSLGDPRTWIPHNPLLSSPPPPPSPSFFNFHDPRTGIPFIPPSPPTNPNNKHP